MDRIDYLELREKVVRNQVERVETRQREIMANYTDTIPMPLGLAAQQYTIERELLLAELEVLCDELKELKTKKPKLTSKEIEQLLMLLVVADEEYVAGYGGKSQILASASRKLREIQG